MWDEKSKKELTFECIKTIKSAMNRSEENSKHDDNNGKGVIFYFS